MKFLVSCIIAALCFVSSPGQRNDILATAAGSSITSDDLSPEIRELYLGRAAAISAARKRLFSEIIANAVLKHEADSRKMSVEDVITETKSRLTPPADERIRAIYEANRASVGDRTLDEMRKPIIEFLLREPSENAVRSLIEHLRKKYGVALEKDVNDAGLSPSDVLARVKGLPITAAMFEREFLVELNDAEMDIYEDVRADTDAAVYSALVRREAEARGVQPETVIRAEITDKMSEFSDDERGRLNDSLKKGLFQKYDARILLPRPKPLVLDVSADDDPFLGAANAPVTVIMFSDFQCPTCARTYPVLKRVVNEYGQRVRLVIRDFPLESIHPNAFQAALAANAAGKQGKFFEYKEMLYHNQNMLDRASLIRYAREFGLNVKRFEKDMADPAAAAEIRKDIADGRKLKVSGTPTIYVNGVKIHRLSAENFREAVDLAFAGN